MDRPATAEPCASVSLSARDTPLGVQAAVAAGMRVFGYAADSDEHALRRAGAEILHSLEDLSHRLGLEQHT